MITLIILIALVIIGIIITRNSYHYDVFGTVLTIFSSVALFFHILIMSLSSQDYDIFKIKQDSLIETLKSSRESGREYENAAIVKEIYLLNRELAKIKYFNKTTLCDPYVDDRFDSLEPIK